jgi:LDH2 family malate/lactate/ureidoglycolate dehydrogenase
MAGHKGYGLAMGMEILASVLSGGLFSSQMHSWISQTAKPTGACFTLIVMDISAFQDVRHFKSRMKGFVETITGSEKRPGMERIYYPGEREGQTMQKRQAEGIDIEKEDEAMFLRLAGRFNLEPPAGLKA